MLNRIENWLRSAKHRLRASGQVTGRALQKFSEMAFGEDFFQQLSYLCGA